jgi:SAM-dependent methyltransferase
VPLICNQLFPSRAAALAAPRGEVVLAHCSTCGLISNPAFDETLVRYTGAYENALHFSPRFRGYAEALAADLVERHGLRGKRIVEIGCGDGAFLSLLCRLGGNRGLGFDAAHVATRSAPLPPGVTILPRPFGDEDAEPAPDLVCCRHVLEHVPDPMAFLQAVRRLAARPETVVFFEVPNVLHTLEQLGIWDVVYEHCLYFSPASLARLFVAAGFTPIAVHETYDRQFLTIEARPASPRAGSRTPRAAPGRVAAPPSPCGRPAGPGELASLVAAFARTHADRLARWRGVLGQMARDGITAVLWGAGSKGVTFLNMLEVPETTVGAVVDVNPRKHGCHVAGTGQRIVGPGELPEIRPRLVIVMNPLYREEIEAELDRREIPATILVA